MSLLIDWMLACVQASSQLLDLFQPKLKQNCVPHRHSMTVSLENSSFLHAFNKWSLLMHDLAL